VNGCYLDPSECGGRFRNTLAAGGPAAGFLAISKAAEFRPGINCRGLSHTRHLLEKRRQAFQLMRWACWPAFWGVGGTRANSACLLMPRGNGNGKAGLQNAMKRRRCLIPADGYYEWRVPKKRKRPPLVLSPRQRPGRPCGLGDLDGPTARTLDTAASSPLGKRQDSRDADRVPVNGRDRDFDRGSIAAARARPAIGATHRRPPTQVRGARGSTRGSIRAANADSQLYLPITAEADVGQQASPPKKLRRAQTAAGPPEETARGRAPLIRRDR